MPPNISPSGCLNHRSREKLLGDMWPAEEQPGFESITGILAVAYLVLGRMHKLGYWRTFLFWRKRF